MIHFSSSAAADIPMFEGPAHELLRMAGRLVSDRGAIAADEVPAALAALRSALAALPTPPRAADPAEAEDDGVPQEPEISLRQRAFPLVDMLERAAEKEVAVLWERR